MTFESNIQNIYGSKGDIWLKALPRLISTISEKYRLSNLVPAANLSFNYVALGFQGSLPITLKLGLDTHALHQEADALTAFSGYGVVNLIFAENNVLLLEQATPGISLNDYFPAQDVEATHLTCDVMKKLHQAPISSSSTFPHIRDWLKALDKDWDIPCHLLQKARHLRDNLLATMTTTVLLHGDLHHDNILQSGNKWVAIDPKGIIGETAYEIGAFIRNPIPNLLDNSNAVDIIQKRILIFATQLNMPPNRILNWCFVQSILCWVWALADKCSPNYFIDLSDIFYKLISKTPENTIL